jgi:predicted ATPase
VRDEGVPSHREPTSRFGPTLPPGEEAPLRSIHLKADSSGSGEFPFTVTAIRTLPRLDLSHPVTFFVGANGSGKSTLLEGIAAAASLPAVGLEEVDRDRSLEAQRRLGRALRLTWNRPTHRGFFLRAEDFFGFTRRVAAMRSELRQRLGEVGEEYQARSEYARKLAEGPLRGSLSELERRYGTELDGRSHGESFLDLFRSRFVPGGLYLLDEPEAALSPQSQLGLLALLGETIQQSAQFIVATHSPILLAFPGALIYDFDVAPIQLARYEDLEHVTLTRDFLNDREQFLRHLF